MLALFRRFLNTWVSRVFFLILVVMFALWGVNDMVSQIGSGSDIATVNGDPITPTDFNIEYQRALKTAETQAGTATLSDAQKKATGYQTLGQMIYATTLDQEARRLNLAVSDDAVRREIWSIKAFQGVNGQFDQATFQQVLSQNNLTEAQVIAAERRALLEAQLLDTIGIGAGAPEILTSRIFGFEAQTRTADVVTIHTDDQAQPPDPTDQQLHRFYDNHLAQYATPEYRKIKLVALTPDTLAATENIPESTLKAYYDANSTTYNVPEKRTVQLLIASDQAHAQQLADAWSKNPDWAAIQKQAQSAGASAVEIDQTTKAAFPTPQLADAVFSAPAGQQIGPVQAGLGWAVARVTAITPPSSKSFDQVKDSIKSLYAKQMASQAIYDQANKLEDAIGASSDLSQVPADIGAAPAEGTLDAQGNTLDGTPAPLPLTGDARTQILGDAFSAQLNQPAEFKEVQDKNGQAIAFYALTVEKITPSSHRPYNEVAAQVRSDWIEAQRRHEAETAAAQLLTTVEGGVKTLATAAGNLTIIHSHPFYREGTPTDIPAALVPALFQADKPGEATMAETPDGFAVAVLTNITTPTRTADPIAYDKLRSQLAQSMRADIENTYTDALRNAAKLSVNEKNLTAAIQ